jgi:hypothetical protein
MRFAGVYQIIYMRGEIPRSETELNSGRVEKMEQEQQPTYASDHLYLVAFLTCTGHKIVGTRRHGHRVAFEFAETAELLSDVAGFMGGAAIPARQFSFEVLKLKRTLNGG